MVVAATVNAYARAKLRHWGAPVPSHLKHGEGTYAMKVYGCDCPVCLPSGRRRSAAGEGKPQTQRSRELRNRKRGQPVPPGTKHGVYPYGTYGCRCDVCSAAHSATDARRRAAHRDRSAGWFLVGPETTTIHWPPVGVGIWTCPTCGLQLRHRRPGGASSKKAS